MIGIAGENPATQASLAQLVEHALRKRRVVGSIPTGGFAVMLATAQRNGDVSLAPAAGL